MANLLTDLSWRQAREIAATGIRVRRLGSNVQFFGTSGGLIWKEGSPPTVVKAGEFGRDHFVANDWCNLMLGQDHCVGWQEPKNEVVLIDETARSRFLNAGIALDWKSYMVAYFLFPRYEAKSIPYEGPTPWPGAEFIYNRGEWGGYVASVDFDPKFQFIDPSRPYYYKTAVVAVPVNLDRTSSVILPLDHYLKDARGIIAHPTDLMTYLGQLQDENYVPSSVGPYGCYLKNGTAGIGPIGLPAGGHVSGNIVLDYSDTHTVGGVNASIYLNALLKDTMVFMPSKDARGFSVLLNRGEVGLFEHLRWARIADPKLVSGWETKLIKKTISNPFSVAATCRIEGTVADALLVNDKEVTLPASFSVAGGAVITLAALLKNPSSQSLASMDIEVTFST